MSPSFTTSGVLGLGSRYTNKSKTLPDRVIGSRTFLCTLIIRRLVGLSVCHNFLKGREVTLHAHIRALFSCWLGFWLLFSILSHIRYLTITRIEQVKKQFMKVQLKCWINLLINFLDYVDLAEAKSLVTKSLTEILPTLPGKENSIAALGFSTPLSPLTM